MTGIKPDHISVRHSSWRGRVHCTLASDLEEEGVGEETMSCDGESPASSSGVFSDRSIGEMMKARVVAIRDRTNSR